MRYVSTRGRAAPIGFREAVLSGLAPDGGLYVPEAWPADALSRVPRGAPFHEIAGLALAPFAAPDLARPQLEEAAAAAFATFDRPDVAPLSRLGDLWLLELFHGPTLAFKDVAMQLLARLYDWALEGASRRKTILCATSGDTGGAAIAAFAAAPAADLFVLHPKGRISEVQRRIMTTIDAPNVVNVAVKGDFDDCQRIVKALFADPALATERDLGGVNSINWVRLAIQMSYYAAAAAWLDADAPGSAARASYVVPTGNFGDAFAAYAAKKSGLAMGRIGVAVNDNDILHRTLSDGAWRPRPVTATTSPSMDIQVASNFERLLFDAVGRDAERLSALMADLAAPGGGALPPDALAAARRDFGSARADEAAAGAAIADARARFGALIDPHTAVGVVAARALRAEGAIGVDGAPVVVLATAHPAKFPDAVEAATGERPAPPARYADLFERPERLIDAPADVGAVRDIVLGRGA